MVFIQPFDCFLLAAPRSSEAHLLLADLGFISIEIAR